MIVWLQDCSNLEKSSLFEFPVARCPDFDFESVFLLFQQLYPQNINDINFAFKGIARLQKCFRKQNFTKLCSFRSDNCNVQAKSFNRCEICF